MALFWRAWAAFVVVNLAVLAIFVGLATLQFDDIHSGLVGERLVVLADRTAGPFQAATKIGLPLSAVRNAPALLERARQSDDSIAAIHVFDADGRVVHSTESAPSVTIPRQALTARAGDPAWYGETAEAFLGSVPIAGRGEGTAGGVLVAYPTEGNTTRVRAMAAELALGAIGVLLASAVVGGLLLRVGLAPQIRQFDAIDQAVSGFERHSWRSAAAGGLAGTEAPSAAELRRLLDAADARYRAAGQAIAASEPGAPQ